MLGEEVENPQPISTALRSVYQPNVENVYASEEQSDILIKGLLTHSLFSNVRS